MSDGTTLNSGTGGDTLATHDSGGMKHQQVELEFMVGSTPTKVSTASGGSLPARVMDSYSQEAFVFPSGFLRVTDEPRQSFFDPFDAALDTTVRWNAGTTGSGGSAASVTSGLMSVATNTSANAFSMLDSRPTFSPTMPGWLGASFVVSLSAIPSSFTNALAFWGLGTAPGTPTAAAPLTNACGFEVAIDGTMHAVVYVNGSRTDVATLTGVTDFLAHLYIVLYRGDRIYWYIDGMATPVASQSFVTPQVETLPVRFLVVNHSSGPGSARFIQCSSVAVWDTAKNHTQLADATSPWQRLAITAKGTQGTYAAAIQHLRDAGRTHLNYYATAAAAAATTTEAMITLTKSSGVSATSTGTSFTITAGKRFRITSITFATRGHSTATIQTTTFSLRVNTAGATVNTSTPIVFQARSATPATASAWDRATFTFPEGFEILGDGTLTFGVSAVSTYTTNAPTLDVMISGYEY